MPTLYTCAQVRKAIAIYEGHPDIGFLERVARKMENGHDWSDDVRKLNTMLRPIEARLRKSVRIIRRQAA